MSCIYPHRIRVSALIFNIKYFVIIQKRGTFANKYGVLEISIYTIKTDNYTEFNILIINKNTILMRKLYFIPLVLSLILALSNLSKIMHQILKCMLVLKQTSQTNTLQNSLLIWALRELFLQENYL